MPLTLTAGISKKAGLPNYSSIGASCEVRVELDASILASDLETFHRRVRAAYVACSQAVNDELARQRTARLPDAAPNGQDHAPNPRREPPHGSAPVPSDAAPKADEDHQSQPSGGNGPQEPRSDSPPEPARQAPPASIQQLKFLNVLASHIRGLGVRRLEALCRQRFARPLAQLSAEETTGLIDQLKTVRNGTLTLESLWQGATP